MTTAIRPTPLLAQAADAWFDGIEDPVEQALTVLKWAGDTFGDDFAITSSMADGLLAQAGPDEVGRTAFSAGVAVLELRAADSTGLEEMFLQLTADTSRDPGHDLGAHEPQGALA